MMLIDYHCHYSHNWCVRSCELGLELGALSAFVKWKHSSSDDTLMLLHPAAAGALRQPGRSTSLIAGWERI